MNDSTSSSLTASLLARLQARADQEDSAQTATNEDLSECAELLAHVWHEEFESNGSTIEVGDHYPHPFGRFEVRRLLGQGSFSAVFEAFDPSLPRVVALKVPRPEVLVSPSLRRRFERDAEISAALHHPNIVPIYEVGHVGPVCYTVAEFIDGPNLAEWIRHQTSPVSPLQAASLVATLADAVAHAHEHGVLHRDIKPSNVLLEPRTSSNHDGLAFVPKLADFGLAKGIEETDSGTRTGVLVGTTAYMSPEQAAGRSSDVGIGSDIYSLGVVLFELLTGKTPFAGDTPSETLRAIMDQDAPNVRSLRKDVPMDLAAIVEKSLSKEIGHRYQSARELADDLRSFLDGRPVVARPLGHVGRLVRWSVRRPALAGLTAALLVAMLAGVTGVVWQWRIAERNRQTAEAHAAKAEKNLAEAYRLLTELGLVAQESQLWEHLEDPFRRMLAARISENFIEVLARPDLQQMPAELRAVAHGIEGQRLRSHQHDDAHRAFAASVAAWRELAAGDPSHRRNRRAYALSLLGLGMAIGSKGDLAFAVQTLEEGQSEFEQLIAEEGVDARIVEEYATLLMELGGAFVRLGRSEEAAKLYERSLERFASLAKDHPEDANVLLRVGQLEQMLGSQRANLRDRESAENLFKAAIAHLEDAGQKNPTSYNAKFHLAESFRVYGTSLADRKKPLAKQMFERGSTLAEELAREHHGRDDLARLRAGLARGLAYAYRREGADRATLLTFRNAADRFGECHQRQLLSTSDLEQYGRILYEAAVLGMDLHEPDRAKIDFHRTVDVLREANVPRRGSKRIKMTYAHALLIVGDINRDRGEDASAGENYQEARSILQAMHDAGHRDPAIKDWLARAENRTK